MSAKLGTYRRQITPKMYSDPYSISLASAHPLLANPRRGELSTYYPPFYRRGKHMVLPTLLCNLVLDPSTADGKRFSLLEGSQKCLLGCKMPWAFSDNCIFSRHRNS